MKGEAQETAVNALFNTVLPKFLKICEDKLAKGRIYICGDKITIADFYIGGLYPNLFVNDKCPFGGERWAACLENYPNFKAYGERFAADNAARLTTRNSYGI